MELGGSKIDGDFMAREVKERVADGRADAIFGLVDGFVGHADNIKSREATVDVALDVDEVALISLREGRENFCDHVYKSRMNALDNKA